MSPPARPLLVPRGLRPTPAALAVQDDLVAAGWFVAEDALLSLDRPGETDEPILVLAGSAADALDAVRAGALEALVWPEERERLPEILERARRALEDRLRSMAIEKAWRAGSDWVEIADPDARLVDVNAGFERISGYAAEDAIGRTPGQLFRAGTHAPSFYARLHEEASTVGWEGGLVGRRRDGTWCVQDARIGHVRWRGRRVAMVAVKRAANDPGSSPLSALLAELTTLPWLLVRAADGVIMEASVPARRQLGLALADGATMGDLGLGGWALPAPDAEARVDLWQGPVAWELTARGVLVGDVPVAVVVLRDVTSRRKREEELDRLAGQLLVARDEARAADQAKSAFLAGMSHELRTPLNAILGYAELLSETLSDPEQRGDAGRVVHAGRHLLGLVDELLDLARIEAGRIELDARPIDVRRLMDEVADALRLRAAARGQALVVEGPPTVVSADPRRLRQILLNLAGNATKYAVPGRVVLGVSGEAAPVLWVEDQGPGMDEAALRRIFQPYTQLSGDGAGGVGLGLTICERLATAMGLALEVRSAVGEGTRFSVRFPERSGAG